MPSIRGNRASNDNNGSNGYQELRIERPGRLHLQCRTSVQKAVGAAAPQPRPTSTTTNDTCIKGRASIFCNKQPDRSRINSHNLQHKRRPFQDTPETTAPSEFVAPHMRLLLLTRLLRLLALQQLVAMSLLSTVLRCGKGPIQLALVAPPNDGVDHF